MAGKFEPKTAVNLDPPKDDPITLEELAQADGKSQSVEYSCLSGRDLNTLFIVQGLRQHER